MLHRDSGRGPLGGARAAGVALALVAAIPIAVTATHAQEKFRLKAGARGKLCLECHSSFQETMALPFVHTPVKAGSCADCHNPHASTHGKLLAAEPNAICASCHEEVPPAGAASIHDPVAAGRCVDCHDPHAAANKANLRLAGNALCASCHEEVVAQAAQAAFEHAPVEKSCLFCHDAHASGGSDFLLRKQEPDLCLGCHKTDQPAFARQHRSYPVAGARCTSCHDPHGSSRSGLLWANVHQPLLNGMCNQCHLDPGSPDALKTKKQGFEVCRGCHSDVLNQIATSKRVHWPALDAKGCLNCHSPHASREAALLVEPVKPLCGSCHSAAVEILAKAAVKHPPAEEGNCSLCHAPHASNAAFLFPQESMIAMCGACHDWGKHSSHPLGEKVPDPRNDNLMVDCASCHAPHASPFPSFAHLSPDSDLCVQCHKEMRR